MLREAIAAAELMRGEVGAAVSARFAAANLRVVRGLLWLFAFHWLIVFFAVVHEEDSGLASGVAALLVLGMAGFARVLRRRPAGWLDERATVMLVVALLLAQQVFMVIYAWRTGLLIPALIVPPMVVLLFQLVPATRIALHATWFGLGLVTALLAVAFGGESEALAVVPGILAGHLVTLGIGAWRSRGYRRRIEAAWDASAEIYEDRLRMQRELETARQIQLSMLPREGPALEWIEWATLSLPATEVGGDYYGHHVDGRGGLVVTVADVAGYGLASGLLLSGLRACLALLEDVADPRLVCERLHHMVRRTRHDRAFVTLAQVRLEQGGGRGEVAFAGHPPMLVVRGDGRVEEIGGSSTPLGAMDRLHLEACTFELEVGDVLLLTTDGVYETLSDAGVALGIEGLGAALAAACAERREAQSIRDGLLRRVWAHKGDARQEDDLTMVVMVRRSPAAVEQ